MFIICYQRGRMAAVLRLGHANRLCLNVCMFFLDECTWSSDDAMPATARLVATHHHLGESSTDVALPCFAFFLEPPV